MNDVMEQGFAPTMEQIQAFERELAVHPGRVRELPVNHYFSPGMYAREMIIPAGVWLTGRTHKDEHLCTISAGEITVWSEGGEGLRLQAPCTFTSFAGVKRVGYAHTAVVFTTFHLNPTNETNIEKLEELLTVPGADQPLDGLEPPVAVEALEGVTP